ncbi:MAG: glycogen debranching N-terminal domain-containing protein [Chloroflexota bacterium]
MSQSVTRATDLTGTLVLKHDRRFLLSDAFGDLRTDSRGLGLYEGDTRVLSRLELRIDGQRPLVLRTGTSAGFRGVIQMTNPDLARNPLEQGDAAGTLARQSLGIVRERLVSDAFDDRVRIHNYTMHPGRCLLTLALDADFADIFEVRGVRRPSRGERAPAAVGAQEVRFEYRGLDGRLRRTLVAVSEPATRLPLGAADGAGHGRHRRRRASCSASTGPSQRAATGRSRCGSPPRCCPWAGARADGGSSRRPRPATPRRATGHGTRRPPP